MKKQLDASSVWTKEMNEIRTDLKPVYTSDIQNCKQKNILMHPIQFIVDFFFILWLSLSFCQISKKFNYCFFRRFYILSRVHFQYKGRAHVCICTYLSKRISKNWEMDKMKKWTAATSDIIERHAVLCSVHACNIFISLSLFQRTKFDITLSCCVGLVCLCSSEWYLSYTISFKISTHEFFPFDFLADYKIDGLYKRKHTHLCSYLILWSLHTSVKRILTFKRNTTRTHTHTHFV